jgi:chromosome condensin MukBEF MukE localization factor
MNFIISEMRTMVGSFIPFVYLSPHQNMEIASEWSVNHYLLLDLRL